MTIMGVPRSGSGAPRARRASLLRRALTALTAVVLVVGGAVALDVASAPTARADVIPVEPWQDISARYRTHIGYSVPAPGTTPGGTPLTNAVRFGSAPSGTLAGTVPNPGGTLAQTAFVSDGTTAWVAHGRQATSPLQVNLSEQSALGFEPRSLDGEIVTDVPFNLGRSVHLNNVILTTSAEYWRGSLDISTFGTLLTFDYEMHETPNVEACGTAGCDDTVTFLNEVSGGSFFAGDRLYTLVINGFTSPQGPDSSCDATLDDGAAVVDQFVTAERTTTYGCLYATFTESSFLTIQKTVEAPYSTAPADAEFAFTSESTVLGSPWDGGRWSLGDGDTRIDTFLRSEGVTVTEAEAGSPWELADLRCVDETGADLPGVVYDGASVTIPPGVSALEVLCTYTNRYVPRATLTLEKEVEPGSDPTPATPAAWTLGAQGTGAVTAESVSGLGGSEAVVDRSVVAGTYRLGETVADEVAAAGYVQDGPWVCATVDGEPVAVDGEGQVTLAEGDDVTCTVTNAFTSGSLAVTKTVTTVPDGGYDRGDALEFEASYACLPAGPSGTVTITPSATNGVAGTPVLVTGVPAGSECTVTEVAAPTGTSTGLVDASWTWLTPSDPTPATIAAGETTTFAVGNAASQSVGELTVSVAVEPRAGTPASGYTGGDGREIPVSYRCVIGDEVVAEGVLTVSPGSPVTVLVPVTAECSLTEVVLDPTDGDFADDTFGWDGATLSAPVVVTAGDAASLAATAYFVREITDPEPTDPEPTSPEPTDPEPTDPEPTSSEPTDPSTPGTTPPGGSTTTALPTPSASSSTGTGGLAATGSEPAVGAVVALLLAALGGAAVLLARRRSHLTS